MRPVMVYLAAGVLILLPVGLSFGAGGAVTADTPTLTPAVSLRALAEARGFYVGTAVQAELLVRQAEYAATARREYNMVVAEFQMKMAPIEVVRGVFDFAAADAIVKFAELNGMAVRGHTLVWHGATPDWVNRDLTRDEAIDILHEYITTVVGRYRGRVMAWDVVNEAVDDTGLMRRTVWYDLIGPDYIDMAFQWAHETDPDALLFYNDYNAEGMNRKSDAVYALVSDLLARGVPIHGVGLQMHLVAEQFGYPWSVTPETLAANIERLGALGLQVHITEMDVRSRDPQSPQASARQAEIYHDVLAVCLKAKACTAFLTWGFTDRYSWIRTWMGQEDARPLPFDEDYQPKPAYYALVEAFQEAAGEEVNHE